MDSPPTALEILEYIKEKAGPNGISIHCYDRNNRFHLEYWSIRGCGVDASAYKSLAEAFIQWKSAIEYLEERNRFEQ